MKGLRFLTAGESHGPGLTVIVDGIPAGLTLTRATLDRQLRRRQGGYGRGDRMAIESDQVEIRGGVRHGTTLGGPIALLIDNRDFANWRDSMNPDPVADADLRRLTRPRPGHADLAGALKLETTDARPILERASARETAARVVAGGVAQAFLLAFDVRIGSHTLALGDLSAIADDDAPWASIEAIPDDSPFRTADPSADLETRLRAAVDAARSAGDTLGGRFEVVAHTPPPGLGHFTHWDRRLDGRIGQAMLSIPATKSVAIGHGASTSAERGSAVHDAIRWQSERPHRPSNRAGGLEGGMTNGEEVRVTVGLKPLSTLKRALESVDMVTHERSVAAFERSDVTVVPAAGVVGEAMLALVLADATLDKFGGDSMGETLRNHRNYLQAIGWRREGPLS